MKLDAHLIEVAQILAEGLLRLHLREHRQVSRRLRNNSLDVSAESSGYGAHESRNGETT